MPTIHARHLTHRVATLLLLAAPTLLAQQTTTTTTTPQGVTKDVQVENSTVVYVSGDTVVLRNAAGDLQLLSLPAGETVSVNGQPTAPRDLKPGTTLTHVHMRSVQQSTVTNVTQIDGTVIRFITPNSVILRLGDNTVDRFTIPSHANIQVDGRDVRPSDLRPGMRVSATVVRTNEQHTHSNQTSVSGAVATPPQRGTLLIFAGPARE
ncbi:hypothetical protein EDE15_3408 [Edaphobacter aggregans]|uniref:DUF5666 domain-containing protein n=1 Tax=Edaphobacter aggregans TaxID=570835 RepID=A0A428MLY3_9BACT|nr:hypothetical protein [Edaphobacter aggregans]RSL17859.1 hypothetical protein EDE15_3408 [Edaphobacter aggregans]